MSPIAAATAIALPEWYASVSRRRLDSVTPGPTAREARRIDALTVFQPSRGCEIATFKAGTSAVLFDGYLFDRADVARDLGRGPERSTTAEIVVAAYERWGSDLYDRLDGSYLIAVWDAEAGRLLLGHDALGRHPVFYAMDGDHVWFASNILALARSGSVPARPNRVSLALAPLLFWPEAGQTFFADIRRVRPGHYLEITSGHATERLYWEPMPADDEPMLAEKVVHDMFEPSLERAVARCLELDVQGIMLSGGVDSVTVAALAARRIRANGGSPLVGVSSRTGQELIGEERMQSAVASALAMPHIVSTTLDRIGNRNPLSMSLDIVPELPGPSDVWWVGTYTQFYRESAARGVNVLLTGAGGDNWLGVADAHAADLMRQLRISELYRFLKSDLGTGGASLGDVTRRMLWAGGVRWHLDSMWARIAPTSKAVYHRRKWLERLPVWLVPEPALRQELVERLLARRTPALTADGRAPGSYYLHSLRTLTNPYMHHENETAFHIEASCGLRLLSPYHDRRLVSFFNRIPPRVLIHGDRYKGLLRPIVAKHLPGLGLEDQRKDYPAELQDRKLTELRAATSGVWPAFGFEGLGDLGVVDPGRLKSESADTARKGFRELSRMFTLMSMERWIRASTPEAISGS